MPPSFPALVGWHDVFLEILNHLEPPKYDIDNDDDGYYKDYRASLRAFPRAMLYLALSCRAFLDPSLDKLWYRLHSIYPLLELLPNYQDHESRPSVSYSHTFPNASRCRYLIYSRFEQYLTGAIPPQAWSRLRAYAIRVRHIDITLSANDVDPSVWQTLFTEQGQDAPIFPNLRTLGLRIQNTTQDDFTPIHTALSSPYLREVFLRADDETPGHNVGIALQEFSLRTPEIVRLVFSPSRHERIDRQGFMCLSRFTQMEYLYLNDHSPLDEDRLLIFNNLRRLRHLGITFKPRERRDAASLELKDVLQNLTTLKLHCKPAHLTQFILAFSFPWLNELGLRLGLDYADAFPTSLPSICHHIGSHTLTCFQVELDKFKDLPPPHLMDLLEPLLPFANLEKVEFRLEEHLPLRDADLERLSAAWPRMRILRIIQWESTADWQKLTLERPTIHGLIVLARGCPRLARLCIPDLDASALPVVDSIPRMGHGLLNLRVQNIVGARDHKRQRDVAAVLDRLFNPRLKLQSRLKEWELRGPRRNTPLLVDAENISELLREMQVAREHSLGSI